MKKKIVFVRGFHIDPEPRLEKAIKWLNESFSNIIILAIGWDREKKSKKNENKNGYQINRMTGFGAYGKGFKRNILGLILFNIYVFIKLLFNKVDIIHACDLDTAIPCYIIAKLKRAKLVYDIYDFYSDNRNLKCFDMPVRKLEQFIAKKADLTIICDERRMSQLAEQNIGLSNVIVIYNTPDDYFNKDKMENSYTIGYVGVLIENRRILETIQCLSKAGCNMVCAGFGILDDKIKAECVTNDKVKFFGKVDYTTALKLEASCRAILAMYDPSLKNNRYAAPNKLCEAMMLSKPIITSKGTLCAEIVENEKIGFVIEHNNEKEMIETLKFIKENKEAVNAMGKRARMLYEEKYSANIAKETLILNYKNLLGD